MTDNIPLKVNETQSIAFHNTVHLLLLVSTVAWLEVPVHQWATLSLLFVDKETTALPVDSSGFLVQPGIIAQSVLTSRPHVASVHIVLGEAIATCPFCHLAYSQSLICY